MIRWPKNAPLPSRTVTAAAGGDTTALDQLLRNFRPLVRHVLQRVPVEYHEDVEDEIYVALLMSLSAFKPFVQDHDQQRNKHSAYKSRPSALIDR